MREPNIRNGAGRGARPGGRTEAQKRVFVGFWTWPQVKASLQTLARIERKSMSVVIDEIVCEALAGRRRR